jgi:pimeloyl-[acyl-carrier protein] methyl ester esterase
LGKISFISGWAVSDLSLSPFLELLQNQGTLEFISWQDILENRLPTGERIIGWSMGAIYLLELLIGRKIGAKNAVLISGTSSFISRTGHPSGWAPRILNLMRRKILRDPATVLNNFYDSLFTEEEKKTLPSSLENLKRQIPQLVALKDQLEQGLAFLMEKNFSDSLSSITVPLLLIHGSQDAICPPAAAHHIAQILNKNAESLFFPESGHLPFLSHSGKTLNAITSFWECHD